jgi:hypothetical protein
MPEGSRGKSFFYLLHSNIHKNMNRIYEKTSLLLLITLCIGACAYNTRDEAPQPGPTQSTCDETVKYRYAQIQPILDSKSCTGCHDQGGTSPDLSDSTKVRAYINSNKNKFITAIRFEGDHPMPKNGPEMPDSLQKKIENWICQGMK